MQLTSLQPPHILRLPIFIEIGQKPNQERFWVSAEILMVDVVSSGRVTIMSCTLSQSDSGVAFPTSSSQSWTCSMIISSRSTRCCSSGFIGLQILLFRSVDSRVLPMNLM